MNDQQLGYSSALDLLEAPGGGVFNPDGTVTMVIIRPSNGRGMGQHIYTAEMLRENAQVFSGVPMFDNHESPQAARARGTIPRAPSELGGWVQEAWWDENYSTPTDAERGFDKGAVIGRCRLTDLMESLVRKIPQAIKTSINAKAAGVRRGERNGKPGWIVEGIRRTDGMSVDLVTIAGAGGEVASLIEAGMRDGWHHEDPCHDPASDPNSHIPPTTGEHDVLTNDQIEALVEAAVGRHLSSQEFANRIGAGISAGIEEIAGDLRDDLRESLHASLTESLGAQLQESIAVATAPAVDYAAHAAAFIDSLQLAESAKATLRKAYAAGSQRLELVESAGGVDLLEATITEQADELRELLAGANPSFPTSRHQPGGATSAPAADGKPYVLPSIAQLQESGVDTSGLQSIPTDADEA